MSSAIKRIAQIDSRVKYLITLGSTKYWDNADFDTAFPTNRSVVVVDYTTSINPSGDIGDINPVMLKDLGREIYIHAKFPDGTISRAAILRQVQRVEGLNSNGVPDEYPNWGSIWVCTWSANPVGNLAVTVARSA